MDSPKNKKIPNRLKVNNKCKTLNCELKFSHNKKSPSKHKQENKKIEQGKKNEEENKKKEEKKEKSKININTITNNNNSHNIYVINNYFEEKKTKENLPIGKWKDGKRYDRKGIEIKKGGKQKLTFIDKIGKGKLIETIQIESFKEYNLIEEVSDDRKNSCCYFF